MLKLLRRHQRFFLWIGLAGFALRLFFFAYFPAITDDSRIYADLATNWLQHGIYGTTQAGEIVPTDERLPGYPAFLAAVFAVFGVGNFRAVLLIQILFDLGTCLIIADLARRTVSERAARAAFLFAALCPFLANYSAAVLTETLEIFFTALALDCVLGRSKTGQAPSLLMMGVEPAAAVDSLDQGTLDQGTFSWKQWAMAGVSIAACILLRPDGGILLAAACVYLGYVAWKRLRQKSGALPVVKAVIVMTLFALAPLAPWTIRNLRTLQRFQPLAPRYASEPEELTPLGFNRWARTWIADYASVEEIYWNVPGDKIDGDKLPSRAFDSTAQMEATLAVVADYNQSHDLTPELDARFDALAAERIREHPVRYYVLLPAIRIADMWLRPRTELLPSDARWWEFDDDPKGSITAVAVGLLNLAYIGAALIAAFWRFSAIRYAGLLLAFVALRSAFLGSLENPEPRYTLECYPIIILFAAALAADWRSLLVRRYKSP